MNFLSMAYQQKHQIWNYGPTYSSSTDNRASVLHTLMWVAGLQHSPLMSHCLNVICSTPTTTQMQSHIMSALAGTFIGLTVSCPNPNSLYTATTTLPYCPPFCGTSTNHTVYTYGSLHVPCITTTNHTLW